MSSPSPSLPTITIFGGTAGTGLSVLKRCLRAGYTVKVLARTPSKLSSLSAKYPNLHIIQGDIHNLESIKQCLIHSRRIVDIIISSIGMTMQRKGLSFTSVDTTICETGTKNILQALEELESDEKIERAGNEGPKMIFLSTTGISAQGRDIPIPMVPLYHWMLHVPHDDKRKMESVIRESDREWVVVRPSLLFDGNAKGLESVRTSTEGKAEGKEGEVAIGYTIRREDVGLWIFEECVRKMGSERWEGKMVTLTY